jgi:parallel beta-helix repeat protein
MCSNLKRIVSLVLKVLLLIFLNFPFFFANAQNNEKFFPEPSIFPNKLHLPGRINGKGSYFEIKDSRYLNVSLFSEKEIEVSLESVPKMVSLILSSSTEATTTLTLKGFEPNKKYYKYEDSYKNGREILTDESGTFTWPQDLTRPHHLWFQEGKSTIFLPDDCSKYRSWNPETKTCTLTQDLTESVEIESDNVTLDCNGRKINYEEFGGIGIYLNKRNNVVIKNCNITHFFIGIYLFESTLNKISGNNLFGNGSAIDLAFASQNNIEENNVFQNNRWGISLFESKQNKISDNEAFENYEKGLFLIKNSENNVIVGNYFSHNGSGIILDYSSNNFLRKNSMEKNKYNFGIGIDTGECGFEQDIDTSNTVDGKPIYYLMGEKEKVIDKNTNVGYLAVINSENVVIKDLTFKNNHQGILLVNCKDSKIENIIAEDNVYGIELIYSSHNQIAKNMISKNIGIGIFLDGCSHNEISENEISENSEGITLYGPSIFPIESYNTIFKNNISKNNFGISLDNVSKETIKENNVSENEIALEISYSENNLIYHNNFINNETQATSFVGEYRKNYFDNDYPEGGNYWSDYDTPEEGCFDENKDGFCDAPYTFEGGQDNYPFVKENGWLLKENQPPIPIIKFLPKNPVKGVKVKFDASSSTDPDGEIKKFFWEIKRGEEILATSTAATTTFAFPENGEYQITLTIANNDNAASSTSTTIKVEPFSFAIITDLHIGRGYPDYDGEGFDDGYNGEEYYLTQRLRNVVNWINAHKENYSFKFVAVLGDIADTVEKSEFCKAKEILDELEIPYIPVFGNHDVWPYTEKESASTTLGEDFFERIFWSTTSIPCENASSARNFETLLKDFNFEKDIQNPKFKNFIFNYSGINFIGLDFNSREKEEKWYLGPTGARGEAVNHPETIEWLKEKLNELGGKEPVIIFSHEPFAKPYSRSYFTLEKYGFIKFPTKDGNFSEEELEEIKQILQDYENILEGQQILANFGGHIHGFEKFGKELRFFGQFSPIDLYFDANWQYSHLSTVPVLTTEAIMVGGNEKNLDNKGLIRIVKIEEKEKINFSEIEFKEPALNPYITFEYKIRADLIYPCVVFVPQTFTKREIDYFVWDFGDGKTATTSPLILGGKIEHCYSPFKTPYTYNVILAAIDKETNKLEVITKKVEIKEGIIPKIIKVPEILTQKNRIYFARIRRKGNRVW